MNHGVSFMGISFENDGAWAGEEKSCINSAVKGELWSVVFAGDVSLLLVTRQQRGDGVTGGWGSLLSAMKDCCKNKPIFFL